MSKDTDKMYKEFKAKEAEETRKKAKATLARKRASLSHNPLKDEKGPLDKNNLISKQSIISSYGAKKKR